MIIDYTYFQGGFTPVAQVGYAEVRDRFNKFIEQYEPVLLRELLGVEMYAQVLAAAAIEPPAAPWAALLDGADYVGEDGNTYHWAGLRNPIKNPITAYVYYQWMSTAGPILTGSGTVMPKNENATRSSPINLAVPAWNDMVDMNYQLFRFLEANKADYPTWEPICNNWPIGCFRDIWYPGLPWLSMWYFYTGCRRGYISPLYNLFRKINLFNL